MIDNELLDELESQHRDTENLLERLADASEKDEQRRLTHELAAMLTQHMEVEESEVYPELQALDAEMGQEANVEHGLAREGIQTLQSLTGEPGFGAAVDMLRAGIAHHVEEEEQEAFPLLRQRLTDAGSAGGTEATKAELYEQAQERDIEGRSTMSKEELADALADE